MKQASKKLLASLLAFALVLSCVLIPQSVVMQADATTGTEFPAVTFADNFLATLGLKAGKVIDYKDYTTYEQGAQDADWVGDTGYATIASSATEADAGETVTGLKIYRGTANATVAYPVSAKNFILKLDMYAQSGAEGNWDLMIRDASGNKAAVAVIPAHDRTTDDQAAQNTIGFSSKGSLSTSNYVNVAPYTLNVKNTNLSMYLVVYNEYVYYVNSKGDLIHTVGSYVELTETNQLAIRSCGAGALITGLAVAELERKDDIFAASINAKLESPFIYRDYRGHTLSKTETADFMSYNSTPVGDISIQDATPAGSDSTSRGLSFYGSKQPLDAKAYMDLSTLGTSNFVLKLSYFHSHHHNGLVEFVLYDNAATPTKQAGISTPASDRTEYSPLPQSQQAVLKKAGSTVQVPDSVWDMYDETNSKAHNYSVDVYLYVYNGYAYYVAPDTAAETGYTVLAKEYIGNNTYSMLYIHSTYGGIVLTNLEISPLVADYSVLDTALASVNAKQGDLITYEDYSAANNTNNWSGGTINSTDSTYNLTGLKVAGGDNTVTITRSISAKNFAVKFTAYFVSNSGYSSGDGRFRFDILNEAGTTVTRAQVEDYKTAKFYSFSDAGKSTAITTDSYTLNARGNAITVYIVVMNGKYILLDGAGNIIHSHINTAASITSATNTLSMYAGWATAMMTELEVVELDSVFEGEGTDDSPFLISNEEELRRAVGTFGGFSYKLTNDIYLNDIDAINWSNGRLNEGYEDYVPNEWFGSTSSTKSYVGSDGETTGAFSGTFDGDGYAIYGLWYNPDNGYETSGLFPVYTTLTVKNLVVDSAYLSGNTYAGILASFSTAGTGNFENVVVRNGYTKYKEWKNGAHGGLVGGHYDGGTATFTNCAFVGTVGTANSHASILGSAWDGTSVTMTNCYAVDGNNHGLFAGTTASTPDKYTVTNCYSNRTWSVELDGKTISATTIDASAAQGQGAIAEMSELDFSKDGKTGVWYATENDTYPQLRLFGEKHFDTNQSGDIDVGDLATIRSIIVDDDGFDGGTWWCDVNGDAGEKIDVLDLVALKNYQG